MVEHIIFNVVCAFEGDLKGESSDYVLQVSGTTEYLDTKAQLKDYEYVHQCYKYDRDVEFVLVPMNELKKPYLRTVGTFFLLFKGSS